MIHTVTFSPSLDYIMEVETLNLGQVNRSKKETLIAGGKGINVSVMLKTLGCNSVAMGFAGGFIGEFIQDFLTKKSIITNFVKVKANSRINVKICGKNETAINGNGEKIPSENIKELIDKISKINDGDILVISGNVPSSLPSNIYEILLSTIDTKKIKIIVDCEKKLLEHTLKYKPFLIKPNKEELEDYFNKKINNLDEIQQKCQILQQKGAKNVIVSLGEQGAFMLTEDNQCIYSKAPKINFVSSVGSGDSLIAGFICEYERSKNYAIALTYGVACGTATAKNKYLATKEEVEEIFNICHLNNNLIFINNLTKNKILG